MSDELKQFYRELQDWIKRGCFRHAVFSTNVGLCSTLTRWSGFNEELYREQKALLIRRTGASAYPFNTDTINYGEECAWDDIYQNPKRLAFIEEHAQ